MNISSYVRRSPPSRRAQRVYQARSRNNTVLTLRLLFASALRTLARHTGNRPLCTSPSPSSKSQAHVHHPNPPGHPPSSKLQVRLRRMSSLSCTCIQAFESKAHPRPESGAGLELELRCPPSTRPSRTKSPSRRGGGLGDASNRTRKTFCHDLQLRARAGRATSPLPPRLIDG